MNKCYTNFGDTRDKFRWFKLTNFVDLKLPVSAKHLNTFQWNTSTNSGETQHTFMRNHDKYFRSTRRQSSVKPYKIFWFKRDIFWRNTAQILVKHTDKLLLATTTNFGENNNNKFRWTTTTNLGYTATNFSETKWPVPAATINV